MKRFAVAEKKDGGEGGIRRRDEIISMNRLGLDPSQLNVKGGRLPSVLPFDV